MRVQEIPAGLPQLARGHHSCPEKGACLMEYVSMLAGESFTDRPRCVDPLLVRLSWWVNDTLREEGRKALPIMAPRFIGTAHLGPQLAPGVMSALCDFAMPIVKPVERPALVRMSEVSQAHACRLERLRLPGSRTATDIWFRFLANLSIREIVRAVNAADDRQLPSLLDVAVTCSERLAADAHQPEWRSRADLAERDSEGMSGRTKPAHLDEAQSPFTKTC
jgi:hypothetical protein